MLKKMDVSDLRNERSYKNSVRNSSAEADEVFCQPCSSEDDWVVAVGYCHNCNEYFCAACLKPHRKQSLTKHHVIIEGDTMPSSLMSQTQLCHCCEPCVQHTNEIVKFYCPLHDFVGCSDCMVLNHKTCKVNRIQDISSIYFSSEEHRELVGMVDKFLYDLETLKHQVQKNKQHINESCTKAVNDIKAFRKEVNDYLDKAEAEILTKVNTRKQTDEHIISKLETEKEIMHNEIKVFEEKLNQQSNKANDLFVTAKKMKKRMSFLVSTLKQMFQKSQVKQCNFEPSSEVREIITSQVSLGKLTVEMAVDIVLQFENEINARTAEETEYCFIIASVIVSPAHIILLDHNNKSVKLFDIEQRKLLAKYAFSSIQSDVAKVSDATIAVSHQKEQKIQFLSITHDKKFILEREIAVNFKCRNLYCQQDDIIIACIGKIVIIKTNGNVVKTISIPDLTMPRSIKPAHDYKSFFVSNTEWQGKPTAIYKLNFDGSLAATYKDKILLDAAGLTVTRDGTMLVCNWSVPGSIYVMSSECTKIKEVLEHNEHVRGPKCVSYCEETNKLFVCSYLGRGSKEKLNDMLKIFQMF